MKSDIVDVEVIFQIETRNGGVCVHKDESSVRDIWLPGSMIEIEGFKQRGNVVTISGPQKLFEEKGLV